MMPVSYMHVPQHKPHWLLLQSIHTLHETFMLGANRVCSCQKLYLKGCLVIMTRSIISTALNLSHAAISKLQQMHNACGVVLSCINLSATNTTARYTCKCTGFQAYRVVSGLGGRIGVAWRGVAWRSVYSQKAAAFAKSVSGNT
jgi:hypothetical protein